MIRLTGKILTKLHAKWNFGLTNSTFHCYKKYFNSQQWLTFHTQQNAQDWKLYAYYSNVLPTHFGTVIWFLCLAGPCLNYAKLLYMESIMFSTNIVLHYKTGINHFYQLRILQAMHLLFTVKVPLFKSVLVSSMVQFGQSADPA